MKTKNAVWRGYKASLSGVRRVDNEPDRSQIKQQQRLQRLDRWKRAIDGGRRYYCHQVRGNLGYVMIVLISLKRQKNEPHHTLLAVNLIQSAGFSHNTKAFMPSVQFLDRSSNSKSKSKRSLAKISRISAYAKFFPMQFLGPTENG